MPRNIIAGLVVGGGLFGALMTPWLGLVIGFLLTAVFGILSYKKPLWAALALVVYLPVQLAFNLGPDLDVVSGRLLALVLGVGWMIKKLKEGRLGQIEVSVPGLAYGLLLVWALGSLSYAPNPGVGFRKWAFLASYMLLPVIATNVFKGTRVLKLAKALSFSGTLAALVASGPYLLAAVRGTAESLSWWLGNVTPFFSGRAATVTLVEYPSFFAAVGYTDWLRAFGTFPDPHMLAFFLELTLPFTLAQSVKCFKLSAKWSLLWAGAAGLQLVALLLTFSRGAYLGLIAGGLAVLGVFIYKKRQRYDFRHVKIIAATLGFLALILMLINSPFLSRLQNLSDPAATNRFDLWQSAFEIITQNPITGVGLGGFAFEVDPTAAYRTPIYAHNLFLDIGAELGLVGLTLFLILLLAPIIKTLKTPRPNLALIMALVAIATHGLFDTPVFSVHFLPVLLLLI